MAQNKKRKGTNPKRNQICSGFNNGMDKKAIIIYIMDGIDWTRTK